jgi:hypothetical protein
MLENAGDFLNSLTLSDILFGACGVLSLFCIMLFSILAGQAEARMWWAVRHHDGDRRARQHQITLGRSHLR